MNPHTKDTRHDFRLEEVTHTAHRWHYTGLWVEVGGLGLIICTININTGYGWNVAFRLVDENNEPLPPIRAVVNKRISAHFSMEPHSDSGQDQTAVTFHMIANCKYAKLQIHPDRGIVRINGLDTLAPDAAWCHKLISTTTALPLIPNYQGGANTVFTYSHSRRSTMRNENGRKVTKVKPKPPAF